MSNYDGIDRLSPGDEDQLRQQQRDWERIYADIVAGRPASLGCWGCPTYCSRELICKGSPGYQCGVIGCDHVAVQGGLCVKHERRVA